MSCTAQMMRPKQTASNWNATFPSQQSTQEQSTIFMKKLLAVAVSEILYLRAIFPEQAFGDRKVEDLDLKILSEKSSVEGAIQVVQWMKGCFQALELKYLRQIQLAVYCDENNTDNALESYIFRFAYHDNRTSFSCNSEKMTSSESSRDIRKATLQLLRTTVLLTHHLNPLPEPAYLSMKLLYYDDVTPADYEPEGFRSCETPSYTFEVEPMNVKVGEINTKFHQMKLRVKTDKRQFDSDNDDMAVPSTSMHPTSESPSSVPFILNNDDKTAVISSPMCPTPDSTSSVSYIKQRAVAKKNEPLKDKMNLPVFPVESVMDCEGNDGIVPQKTESPASIVAVTIKEDENCDDSDISIHSMGGAVRCACEDSEDDGLMIQCRSCGYWQHGFCFAVLKNDDAPDRHFCLDCADVKNPKRKPTDFFLQSLDSKARKDLCVWRRTLQTCLEVRSLTATQLKNKVNITEEQADMLLSKLQKEGYVTGGLGRAKWKKIVRKDFIKSTGIPRYLTRQRKPGPSNTPDDARHSEMEVLLQDTQNLTVSRTGNNTKQGQPSKRKQKPNLETSLHDSQDVSSCSTSMNSKRVKSSSTHLGIKV